MIISTIACVDAGDMPVEVSDYCVENEIQTHYQNDVAYVEDDGNVFAEWLLANGYEFKSSCDQVAIIAT